MSGHDSGTPDVRARAEDPTGHTSGVITHPKFRAWLRPDGIIQIVWTPQTATVREDAVAALEAMAQLAGGRRRPVLVDMRDTGSQDRATLAEWTRRGDTVSAVALIVGTPLSRMVGHFSLSVSKAPFPTRLFDSEAAAIAWLLRFVARE